MTRAPSRLRPPLAAALGLALAAALAPAGAAHAEAAAEPAVTALKFTVDVGGKRCAVDADLYVPAGVDAGNRAPAVLTTNGFGGDKADGSTAATARTFAARGLVSLAYSGLGFGRSGCPISLNDPAVDGRAASALVDFLAGTRAADDGTRLDLVTLDAEGDPRVGMIGGSYGGSIQLATAAEDDRVDALVPMITWNDLSYSLNPNNAGRHQGVSSDTPGVYKKQWTGGFFLIGEAQGLLNPSLDPSRIGGGGCLHFVAAACDTKRVLDSGKLPKEKADEVLGYARSVSPVSYLDRVRTPTLLVQGQADTLFNLNEATATYETLKAQGVDTAMIWQSWGHSGGMTDPASGELDLSDPDLESSYTGSRIAAWFDKYLLDKDTDTGPAFAYYRDWAPAGQAYATADAPPAPSRALHLSGDGALVDLPEQVVRGSREYRNWLIPTSHSESSLAGVIGLPDPKPHDLKGTALDWTTAPLDTPLDVVGAPQLRLKVVSPRAEKNQDSGDAADHLVLFAKLYDVAPDGTKTLVHRLTAPARVADATQPFTVTLPGIVHRYEAGHRLRLTVAASDGAYSGNRGVKPVTVTHAPGDSGTLTLPLAQD
ncbi:CocE/NonD family hydrolase [Streptomyces albidoflavus]|uniref:CocE/NonD family hydrolase n=1 Tax=Streptomyces albidoflavus TaxID=1886 RepID=UPI003409F2A0